MIRILFTLAFLACSPALAAAQEYPGSEVFKDFHWEVYKAAIEADRVAREVSSTLPSHLDTMKKAEAELRKALESEDDLARLTIAIGRYLAASGLVETSGDMIFDSTILVTILWDKHHRGDPTKKEILGDWLKKASAFQKTLDSTLVKEDKKLTSASLEKRKKIEKRQKY